MSKKNVVEFIHALGEITGEHGEPASDTLATHPHATNPRHHTGMPPHTATPSTHARDIAADTAGPGRTSGVVHLTHAFASSQQEENQIAVAFRRLLGGQHLTQEIKDMLLRQFRKVLDAAQADRANLVHLEKMLHPERGGHLAPMGESLTEGVAGQAASKFARLMTPRGLGMAKTALAMLETKTPSTKIKMLIGLLVAILGVLESHPEILATIRMKFTMAPEDDAPEGQDTEGAEDTAPAPTA